MIQVRCVTADLDHDGSNPIEDVVKNPVSSELQKLLFDVIVVGEKDAGRVVSVNQSNNGQNVSADHRTRDSDVVTLLDVEVFLVPERTRGLETDVCYTEKNKTQIAQHSELEINISFVFCLSVMRIHNHKAGMKTINKRIE